MTYFINAISVVLIVTGLIFFLGAAVGLARLPDFYTRMHAAGKGDTLSTILILAGLALFTLSGVSAEDFSIAQVLVPVKIAAIAVFTMLTSPTSTHALMQSGYEDGIPHFRREQDGPVDNGTEPAHGTPPPTA